MLGTKLFHRLTSLSVVFVAVLAAHLALPITRQVFAQQPAFPEHARVPMAAAATLQITPAGGINASTYTSGSFIVHNTSTSGEKIQRINIDLRTALLPDMVFDPDGLAGDLVAKPFTADSGAATVGLAGHRLHGFHNGANNQDGFDQLEVTFNDFNPGEQFTFSIDVDPNSIKGVQAPGPGESGSVSGLELTGAMLTVQFDNGSTYVVETYRISGSQSGSTNIVRSGAPAVPQISVLNVPSTPAKLGTANQVVRVSGTPGAQAAVLVVEAALFQPPGGGYNVQPYDANSAIAIREYAATVQASGSVDVPVVLSKSNSSGGLNYIVAVLRAADGMTSANSNQVVLELDPSLPALQASPTFLDFGPVRVGTTSSPQAITLRNPAGSSSSITVASATLTGPHAGQFSHTFGSPVTLAPGQAVQVQVTFSPTSLGNKAATFGVYHSGSGSPATVSLAGEGTSPLAVHLADFEAQAERKFVLVSWETVSEENLLGFHLYRNATPLEPRQQLNRALIASQSPGSGLGASYRWEDWDAASGETYFYWLEAVELNGETDLYGPVSATYEGPAVVALERFSARPAAGASSAGVPAVPVIALGLLAFAILQRRAKPAAGPKT